MDYSYLDLLAEEVYELFVYRLLHKLSLNKKMVELKTRLKELTAEEKNYVQTKVNEAFKELKKDNLILK